ncbi:ATP synthase mitochondrial F1 complex assembly factor 2 [Coccinella septempunctata]|uniref:ATP synthase mitochondrial F1 complex assembly factor 2 n=1 Tax=Coccinella septempunctata TaxID=41139 RepID=UPI001D08FFC7|nr:ATP synthase mitochondrial F1 complex assembly factor 2 [Coccinella septempunctata]
MNAVTSKILRLCETSCFNKKKIFSLTDIRSYATLKRFYRQTNILKSDGKYEIILDQRKLKTPKGNLFSVESETLALAVAAEWDAQKENISRSQMHITTLCNTVIDNPNNYTKYDLANYVSNYLDTDTILFQTEDDEELYKFQKSEWDPVIEWFNGRYGTNIQKSVIMDGPKVSQVDKEKINRHILSHKFESVYGFVYAVDTLKSVMLSLACIDRFVNVEKAVLLSRLEEEYQLGHWGRVEWAHDLSQQDLQSRLAAVVLFIHCNNQMSKIQSKQ